MEHDYRPRPSVSLHILHHILCLLQLTVIARHEIIHDDLIFFRQCFRLSRAEPSMRRTEKIRSNQIICLLNIAQIAASGAFSPLKMMHRVISHPMPSSLHLFIDRWIFPYVIPYHEESGLYPITVEHIEHPRGGFRNRSVVKCEINPAILSGGDSESPLRSEDAEYLRRLFDQHYSG